MDSLYGGASSSNNFGLRQYFPWTVSSPSAPWMADHLSQPEIDFVLSRIRGVFTNQKVCVRRIQNPFLWGRYVLRYEEMKANGQSQHVKERTVVHATSIANAHQIAADNFDWRLVKRHRYGRGVSFANDAEYCDAQATKNEAFILSGILVAGCDLGHYGTRIPSSESDTTMNRQQSVLVKYNDNEYYPYYVVHK